MATLEQLAEGIRRADAAGNVEDVKALGAAYRALQAQGTQPQPQTQTINPYADGGAVRLTGKVSDLPSQQEGYKDSYVGQGAYGLNEGIANLLGAPSDLLAAGINAGASGINSLTGADIPMVKNPALGSQSFKSLMEAAGAIKPQSADPGKRFVRRIAQDVGAAVVPVGGMAGAAAKPMQMIAKELAMATGSGVGAATAQAVAPDNPWAELAGQIIGAGGINGAVNAAKKAITPFPISPSRLAAADALKREGVDLTGGQITGSKGLQYAESELGGKKIGDITEKQAEQFTSAALRRAGVNATRATPEVMDNAFASIGKQFDTLASRSQLPLDRQLGSDLKQIMDEYQQVVPDSMRAPVIQNFVGDLITAAKGGAVVDGKTYQAFRSRLDRLARNAKNDPQLSDALFSIKNALDDSVGRYLSQTDPAALEAWKQVRSDYRNLLVLETASQRAGENAAMGIISPAALRMAAQSVLGKRSYVRGKNDFAELAQAGQATMSPLPQSGTAPRTAVRNLGAPLLSSIGAVAGAGAGAPGVVAGVLAGAALPKAAGALVLSKPFRKYITNQLLSHAPSGASGIGTGAAALTAQSSRPKSLSPRQQAILQLLSQ